MSGGRDEQAMRHLLAATVEAVAAAFAAHRTVAADSLRERGDRPGQYRLDLVADQAALEVLRSGGVGILSEESGLDDRGTGVVVVVDPVDGSTNASRGIPWYATSLCAVDEDGPWVALVANLATGVRFEAVRGGGATCDGRPAEVAATRHLAHSIVVLNGHPHHHLGWRQYRALGATALDLCAVADGTVDATIDCTVDTLGPWDYLGAALVIAEAGGHIADVRGRDLVVLDHAARRTPVSAATEALLEDALTARASLELSSGASLRGSS